MSRGERIRSETERHRDSEVCQTCPPPPQLPAKRRSSERGERERRSEEGKAAAAEQQSKLDRKQKSSVFSRISFPESEKETKTTKRTSSLLDAAVTSGVIKDHRHQRDHGDRDEEASVFGHREELAASSGHRQSGYEREPSEEEDEDYHFKRRPSRREIMEG